MPTEFIQVRETSTSATGTRFYYQFKLECDCGFLAEIGVPKETRKLVSCPECGALYFMSNPTGMFAQPRLIAVLSRTTTLARA